MSSIDPDVVPYLAALADRISALEVGTPASVNTSSGMTLYAILEDRKPAGTGGGAVSSFQAGKWFTRVLNKVHYGDLPLSANKFLLPAGKFVIQWSAPAHNVQLHKSRLMMDDTIEVVQGAQENAGGDHNNYRTSSRSEGMTVMMLSVPTMFHIQQIVEAGNSSPFALGKAAGVGPELFTWVRVWKL